MTFYYIAQRIRSKTWDNEWMEDLFLNYIPDELLHTFACDCAYRCLDREEGEGRGVYQVVWDIIKVKHRWLRGEVSYQEVDRAFETAHAAVGYRPMHTQKNSSREAAIDAALEAANEEPVQAALASAWAAARSAAKEARDATGASERAWQVERLAFLCEQWHIHGDNAPRLLNAYL